MTGVGEDWRVLWGALPTPNDRTEVRSVTATGFDPQTHGFGFTNRFLGGAVVAELTRQDRLSELVGVQVPSGARLLADVAGSMSFWGTFGLCGGMSWAALDRFLSGRPVPVTDTAPGPGDELFSELVRRQADSMRGHALIRKCLLWQLTPDTTPWWLFWVNGVLKLTGRREWPLLRGLLDGGIPASLTLLRVGGAGDPSRNHQVVAIGYQEDGSSRQIHLYDPNHPLSRPHLDLEFDTRGDLVKCSQSTGEPVRAFFIWSHQP